MSTYWMAVMTFFIGNFTLSNYKDYGTLHGFSEEFLTIVGSAGSILNGLRFLWSLALDYVKFKYVYSALIFINVVFGTVIIVFRSNETVFAISFCMLMFAEGGHSSLMPN
jgi:hypothetical protein